LSPERKTLGLIFAAIIVVGVCVYFGAVEAAEEAAHAEATTTYESALRSCRSGQTLRRTVLGLAKFGAESRKQSAEEATSPKDRSKNLELAAVFQGYVTKFRAEPFIRQDGSKECLKAILKP
jgi:hypothetical protein